MPTSKAIAILFAIIMMVGSYLLLTMWLGITEYWAGFLFLFYWGTFDNLNVERLPHSALGSAGGFALAILPLWLTPWIGAGGATAITLAAILLCVFALIKGSANMLCNGAMMLFLTVATIPHIAGHATPAGLFAALATGVLFFGGIAILAAGMMAKRPVLVSAE